MRYGAASSSRLEVPVRARLLAAALSLAACNDTFISVSTDGRIEVAVHSDGSDADGFILTVDGTRTHTIAAGEPATLTRLSEGTHSLLLTGLASDCQVDGSNPREVAVGPEGTATVAFAVVCV
jgi:hypothetical protein